MIQVKNHKLPVTRYALPVTRYPLPVTNAKLLRSYGLTVLWSSFSFLLSPFSLFPRKEPRKKPRMNFLLMQPQECQRMHSRQSQKNLLP